MATFGGPGQVVDGNAISFVLAHHLLGDAVLSAVLKSIRIGPHRVFSPIVLLTDDCPFERVIAYIKIGVR